jgi:hypothetical protein
MWVKCRSHKGRLVVIIVVAVIVIVVGSTPLATGGAGLVWKSTTWRYYFLVLVHQNKTVRTAPPPLRCFLLVGCDEAGFVPR